MFPDIKTEIKVRPSKAKPLTYKQMEAFIALLPTAQEDLKEMERQRKMSVAYKSPFRYMEKWFEKKYPYFRCCILIKSVERKLRKALRRKDFIRLVRMRSPVQIRSSAPETSQKWLVFLWFWGGVCRNACSALHLSDPLASKSGFCPKPCPKFACAALEKPCVAGSFKLQLVYDLSIHKRFCKPSLRNGPRLFEHFTRKGAALRLAGGRRRSMDRRRAVAPYSAAAVSSSPSSGTVTTTVMPRRVASSGAKET